MKRGSAEELRPCPRNGASWRAGVGRVRSLAFLSILGGFICNSTCSAPRLRRGPKSFFRNLIVPPPCSGSSHRESDRQSSAIVMDPQPKRWRVHINQEVEEMRERLSCGAGGESHHGSVPCAGDGLVFRCRVDRAIADGELSRVISATRVKAGEQITNYRLTSSRSRLLMGSRAVVLRVAIAADRRT